MFRYLEFLSSPAGRGMLHLAGATDFKIHRGGDLAHDESLIERIHTMLSKRNGWALVEPAGTEADEDLIRWVCGAERVTQPLAAEQAGSSLGKPCAGECPG